MFSILLLGFLIGLQHAMEADHVAAVASPVTRDRGMGETARQGLAWGIGHALTLFIFAGLVLMMNTAMPERFAHMLEMIVG
jgi:high-affinity nickel permease